MKLSEEESLETINWLRLPKFWMKWRINSESSSSFQRKAYKNSLTFFLPIAKLLSLAANLRQTLASELPPEQKFIAYHTALDSMMRAAFDISNGFSTLEIYAGKGEPTGDIFKATKSLAEGTVKVINRAAREQMQGAYALR